MPHMYSSENGNTTLSSPSLPIVNILGMRFTRWNRLQVVNHIFACLDRGQGGWLLTANLDHLQAYTTHASIQTLYDQADLIVADGMPVCWVSHLQRQPLPERVAGSDLVWQLAARAADTGRSLYLVGGAPGTAERARDVLLQSYPGLRIVGLSVPQVSTDPSDIEIDALRCELKAKKPDIVYVALGAPKQERVIAKLRQDCPSSWMLGVGISLSFIAGQVKRAPIWMQQLGLEWLHRMLQEPRRLIRRYLFSNLFFCLQLFFYSWSVKLKIRNG